MIILKRWCTCIGIFSCLMLHIFLLLLFWISYRDRFIDSRLIDLIDLIRLLNGFWHVKVIFSRCVWPCADNNNRGYEKKRTAHHAMINYGANEKLDHDTLDKENSSWEAITVTRRQSTSKRCWHFDALPGWVHNFGDYYPHIVRQLAFKRSLNSLICISSHVNKA